MEKIVKTLKKEVSERNTRIQEYKTKLDENITNLAKLKEIRSSLNEDFKKFIKQVHIPISEYKEFKNLFKKTEDKLVFLRIENSQYKKLIETVESEIPTIKVKLADAEKELKQWGKIVQLKT